MQLGEGLWLTCTLKTYGRHIPCPWRAHPCPGGPDPRSPRCQFEVVVEVLLADGAGRHADDVTAKCKKGHTARNNRVCQTRDMPPQDVHARACA